MIFHFLLFPSLLFSLIKKKKYLKFKFLFFILFKKIDINELFCKYLFFLRFSLTKLLTDLMSFPSSDSKMFQTSRPSQFQSTPTNNYAQYSSGPKAFNAKDFSENRSTDTKFSFIANKKHSMETASNVSSNSTTSSISNMATIKTDFITKEKNYQLTIDKLQNKIETLMNENKKLSENISTRSSCIINKSSFDDREQKEQWQMHSILEEKEKIEGNFQKKIEKLLEENTSLSQEVTSKTSEITTLEKKLVDIQKEEKDASNEQIKQIKQEKEVLLVKLTEKDRKYEELEEIYKQKLSQFKKEISMIKTQQKESSPKDNSSPFKDRIKELEEILKKKNEEIQDLHHKLHRKSNVNVSNISESMEKDPKTPTGQNMKHDKNSKYQSNKGSDQPNTSRLGFEGQRDSRYNLGQGVIKCNWEELEKKITSLVDENDKLTENCGHQNGENVNWKQKFIELEERFMQNDGKEDAMKIFSFGIKKENDDLKKHIMILNSDNSKYLEKLNNFEKKSKENQEDYKRKEEDLKLNFEQTLKGLEEQKEKNLMKISKENHELKQHNDELKKEIDVIQRQKQNSSQNEPNTLKKTNEKQPLLQNSSPILIINEMLTPSAKNLFEKTNKDSTKNNNLMTVVENKEENVFNFMKNKKSSNENIRMNYINNNSNVQNQPETVKVTVKTHNSRESQEFPHKYISKNYGVSSINNNGNLKENCNNSKEVSFKENNLKDSNMSFKESANETAKNEKVNEIKTEINSKTNEKFDFLSQKNDFKQGGTYLQSGRNEVPVKKETKIISFNLSDNNKSVVNSNASARYTKV